MAWITPDSDAPTVKACRRISFPDDPQWWKNITGALIELTYERNWEQLSGVTAENAAAAFADVLNSWLDSEDACMIGTVIAYITDAPPSGALMCDGSAYLRADYPTLYNALDAAFIVDSDTFIVPDLRGRTVIGAGSGSGLTARSVNDIGGAESVQLSTGEMPAHSHTNTPHAHGYTGVISNIDIEGAGVPDLLAAGVLPAQTTTSTSISIDSTGGDEPHENMPPFVALKYAIIAR